RVGKSASSAGLYCRPHTIQAVASLSIVAPQAWQIRVGTSSRRKSSSSAASPAPVDPSNWTPQNGQAVAPVPTKEPHSGQRNRCSVASRFGDPPRRIRSASTNEGVSPSTDASCSRVAGRDFQQAPSRAGAESDGEGRLVAAQELRRESIVREPTEKRLSERVGPAPVRFPLPDEEIRGIRAAVPSVLRDGHEPEAGQLGSNLARGLAGKVHPVREFLERDAG